MKIAIISDTHIPSRAAAFPDWVIDVIETCDHTIHAGDFDSPTSHFDQRVIAGGSFTGVVGNMDPNIGLPEIATFECESVRFVVTHANGFGRGTQYLSSLANLGEEYGADIAIGGHTHRLRDETVNEIRVLNPGSATGAAPADKATLLTVDCHNGEFSVSHHG